MPAGAIGTGGVVLLHHRAGDPASLADLDALLPGPPADGGNLERRALGSGGRPRRRTIDARQLLGRPVGAVAAGRCARGAPAGEGVGDLSSVTGAKVELIEALLAPEADALAVRTQLSPAEVADIGRDHLAAHPLMIPRTHGALRVRHDGGMSDDSVTVYWRPGCGFCSSLRRDLERRGVAATWVNIWEDDEGRAFVRSVARGNETVPTVVVGGTAMVNPRGSDVEALVARQSG